MEVLPKTMRTDLIFVHVVEDLSEPQEQLQARSLSQQNFGEPPKK